MKNRNGYLLSELAVSVLVISLLLVVIAQMLATATHRIRLAQQRVIANELASNLLEQITALGFEQIDDDILEQPAIQTYLESALSGWDVKTNIGLMESNQTKQITVSLKSRRDAVHGAVSLTA